MVIPQVRLAHKYPISPWEMIHPPGGDNPVNQANPSFSISAQTKYTHQPSTDTDMIILPEMANAVICPETGKALKHQELITKLRYKI
jgi:hypothetical protein